MRMDQNDSSIPTAKYVVNKYDAETLMKALYEFADEKFAKSIVRNIIKSREQKTIETTFELVDIVKKSLPPKELHKDGHPAKKTFLAIRYLVNSEKGAINTGIPAALDLLKVGGRLGVLTFNSYEDGLVKTIFKKATTNEVVDKYLPPIDKPINYKLVTRKPISPTIEEIERNNRSKPDRQMKYNKLTKQGKKKKSQFFKVAMTASVLLVSSSTALFIPLINSMNQTNEALTAQIEDANKQTEIIQKNNQNRIEEIISEN